MAEIIKDVATPVAESLVAKAMKELEYLRHYNNYVGNFEKKKESLIAKRSTMLKDIEEAKDRNENQIESEVELWLKRANVLIQEDTTGKKKWFGLVPDCFWQNRRGKELEEKTQEIKELIEESNNFARVARSTGLPGIEFYSSPNFMHFKDRKLQFEKLKEALKDDKKFVIGLYGLGGTGKTTMAIEACKEVAESKVFDKVIFSVVSKDANLKKIRDNIAKHLNLNLNEGMDESEQAQKLWKRIAEGEEKVLIILDDVWDKLKLGDIGIPLGRHGKARCAILLSTRDWRVCRDMGCHETIKLEVLNEKDAIDLFLSYAGMSVDDSSNDFEDVTLDIVKECGRLPVAITAVASALKSRPLTEWEQGLERLRNYEPIHDVNEDLKEAYNSLRLSYDNLKNDKAKQLFLLCSLFPEDYEVPIESLTRIAIGLGLCGEANRYSTARSHFTPIKNELIDSCLLLKAGNDSIKMHDLVREVALWIGNKQVQVAMDSNSTIMENIQYLLWNEIDDFPNYFDGRKLEVLLLLINNENSPTVKVPDAIFEGMENLKILALGSLSKLEILAASLFQSPLSLINVRTLVIEEFELGDISILVNLKSLESLDLSRCSIIELPKEIRELEKLRLLEMVECSITGRSNPFEVIGSCLQLEELYYVSNRVDDYHGQITTLPTLQRYHIKGLDAISNYEVDYSISRYFDSRGLKVNFSNEIFKQLTARVEVLKLEADYCNRGWTNIVPDIFSVEDDSMKDQLTRLSLDSVNDIKCLIHTEHLRSGVAIFSRLVELELFDTHVRELCCGPYPVDFLNQLKELRLSACEKLESTLFDGKLELCNLKSIYLFDCSITCLFHPSTAQTLKQLESLDVSNCINLKYIIAETMDDHSPNKKSHDSMFPKLKYLILCACHELEFILPTCFCKDLPLLQLMNIYDCPKLKYIFGQYPEEKDLPQMRKGPILQLLEEVEIWGVPNFINIYAECYLPWPCSDEVQKSSPSTNPEDSTSSLSRGLLRCFWPKSNASTKHCPSASMTTQLDHNQASKVNYVNRLHGLFTPPLYLYRSLRRMVLGGQSELKSLFTLSIASSLKLLEKLEVGDCDTLEHIVIDEEHGDDHMNVSSIFPILREVYVYNCSRLEYVLPAFYSKDIKDLESVKITKAEMLTYVFGKCHADENRNVEFDLNLSALKTLHLEDLPNMVSISAKNYSVKELYLEDISLEGCPQLALETLIDLMVVGHKRQEDLSMRKALPLEKKGRTLSKMRELPKFKNICVEPRIYRSFQNLSELRIQGCKQLKFIFLASTSSWLQKLKKLGVSECEELVSIMEDEKNQKNPMTPLQVCFPELRGITVKQCKSLKCLFPTSSGKLPRLLYVDIEDVPQLEQVFGWKQGEGQKLGMEDVLAKLVAIRLVNLPALHTICQGIDFQTLKIRLVRECATISLTSANDENADLLVEEDDNYYAEDIEDWWAYENKEEESQEGIGKDSTMPQQDNGSPNFENCTNASANEIVEEKLSTSPSSNSDMGSTVGKEKDYTVQNRNHTSPNLSEIEEEGSSRKDIGKDSKTPQQNNGSSNFEHSEEEGSQEDNGEDASTLQQNNGSQNFGSSKEVSKEIANKDSTTHKNNNLPNLTKGTNALENEIIEEKLSTTPSPNSDMNLETTFGEGSSFEKYDNASFSTCSRTKTEKPYRLTTSKELCGKESMDNQQALGESGSSNEAPQRVEEPTSECSSKERSNEMPLTIPSSITGMTSPLISSISSPKKPQIATSATQVETESGSSQSDPLLVSAITDQSAQDQILVNQRETSIDDDLIRLFRIMKDGSDLEADMPYASKIAAFEDDKVAESFADIESSLKMDLHQIANSEEHTHRLENALNFLSTHFSEQEPSSHGLIRGKIDSLHQEIQRILSSFKQASDNLDTFTKLQEKEKWINEQHSQRMEAARTLVSEIRNTEDHMIEMKEQISKLQAELKSKEKEFEDCEIKLSSLQKQKKECVLDTIGFMEEYEAVKKDRSYVVDDGPTKATRELEGVKNQWPSCVAELRKTALLLGILLQQKL